MANLRNQAMIVRMSISQWTAQRIDRKITREVAERHQAKGNVGLYQKHLVSKDQLETIKKLVNQARTFHYENTLPWLDDGARLLPAKNFFAYSQKMRVFETAFNQLVAEFIRKYPVMVEMARLTLNGMFNEMDYPHPNDISGKFAWNVAIDPMPDAEDFRVDLGEQEVIEIREDIERRVRQNIADAVQDLWKRLQDVVSRMAGKLADSDAIFRDSLVENVIELVEVLPRLNLTDDPNLEAVRREIEEKLCRNDAQTLRDNAIVRAKVAVNAHDILNSMSGYMGHAPVIMDDETAA